VRHTERMPSLMPPGSLPERARTILNGILVAFGVNLPIVEATYEPPSLAAGAVSPIQTASVPGAVLGDFARASFSLDLQGVRLNAWVSAADTVTYQFHNPTAGTVDLASGTVRVRVERANP
jgi:hypothetical protein